MRPELKQTLFELMPVLVIFITLCLGFHYGLDARLDEISAPVLLPIIILAIIVWQLKFQTTQSHTSDTQHSALQKKPEDQPRSSLRRLLFKATEDSSVHVGALLLLMALSFTTGGVIERAEVTHFLGQAYASPEMCMLMLVGLLVLIGMVMDPFGAVVLVSSSIAAIAYNNGIHPVHFWMVTLVAFELGYLSPPVALNHLLTRQVVGEAEARLAAQEAASASSWWYRHERLILPITVMGITLVLVSFLPFLWYN